MSREIRRYCFTWKIENISLCCLKKDEFLQSPIFKAESLYNSCWYIKLYPRGKQKSNEGNMACFLSRYGNVGPPEIKCEFVIEVLYSQESSVYFGISTHVFREGGSKGWNNIPKLSTLSIDNSYSNDFITVECDITVNAEKYPLFCETSGVTKVDFYEYSLKQIVKNLNYNCLEVIKIPYGEAWHVSIFVQVVLEDIKIIINRNKDLPQSMSLSCQITLLDVTGIKQHSKHSVHLFEPEEEAWEFPTFLNRSQLNSEKEKYLSNDCIMLQFEIKLSFGTQSLTAGYTQSTSFTSVDSSDTNDRNTLTTLRDDMKQLYKDKTHADIQLHIENETILAHKSILSIRSPVFSAMFDSEMTENNTGSVIIPDLEVLTVNSLLEYMYTGTLEEFDCEIALKLLVAADKYQVLALKEKCAKFLESTLANANVCDVLVVADLVQHAVLENACVEHIKQNSERIFLSDEWKLVIKNNLQLAMKTVTEVSKLMGAGQE